MVALLNAEVISGNAKPGDSLVRDGGKLIRRHFKEDYVKAGYAFASSDHTSKLRTIDGDEVRGTTIASLTST